MWKFAKLRPPGGQITNSTQSEQTNTTQYGRQNCLKSLYFWAFSAFCLLPHPQKEDRNREHKTPLFSEKSSVNFGYISRFSAGSVFNSTQSEKEGRAESLQEEVIRPDEYVDICPNCGGLFSQNARGRRKKFCSEKCRTAWNHRHPNPEKWKNTARTCICPQCGKEFIATREYGQLRKYCSVACSNRGRAAEKKKTEGENA